MWSCRISQLRREGLLELAVVTATIQVQDQSGPTALDGVTVQVYDAAGTTFISEDTTGAPFAAGEVEFSLDGDGPGITYTIRLSLDGWRFPNGATQQIVVTDPPSPPNTFGPFDALIGPAEPLVVIAVEDDQGVPVPIDDVLARIYTSPADVFVTEGLTGEGAEQSGEFSTPLAGVADPGTTYIIRLAKPDVTIVNGGTQTIAVKDPLPGSETNIFDFVGILKTLVTSADPDLCRITGVLTDVSLRPLRRRIIRFSPVLEFPEDNPRFSAHFMGDPTLVRNLTLLAAVQVITDDNGLVDVELPRGGVYEVQLHGFEHPMNITELMQVPDQSAFELHKLLFPFVESVVFAEDPINIDTSIADFKDVDITVTASNEQLIEDQELIQQLLEFTVDDEDIVDVKVTDDSVLTLKPLNLGTTLIQVARKEGTVAPRRPGVPDLIFTPPQVVVT